MKKLNYSAILSVSLGILTLLTFSTSLLGQSTNQNFPTPVTSNEITATIPARDVGDARLTNYFYVFNATQGDVFINVVSSNFNGDIDIFTADNLRPLSKITLYADAGNTETGRVVYLRQPTRLILRIEGRTPNDEAAKFRIKFAGSFVPAQIAENTEIETPAVKNDNQTDVRVNSVGTIIEIIPKPTPKPREIVAETKNDKEVETKRKTAEEPISEKTQSIENQNKDSQTKAVIDASSVTENTDTEVQTKNNSQEESKQETTESVKETLPKEEPVVRSDPKASKKPKSVKPPPTSALENIRLVVIFKDGTRIERPMSEVLKFGIDKGVLTVILKDGTIGRYSLLDVEKTTIE